MTLRLHISHHNDDLHNTTAKRNLASGVAGLDASGNVEDTSGNDCETINNKDIANGYVGLNASAKIDNNLIDLPMMNQIIFRINTGTGTAYFPAGINDNNFIGVVTYSNIGEYCEVDFGTIFFIRQFRQYGNTWNNGTGRFKIEYYTSGAWADLKTGIATHQTKDWSSWSEFPAIVSTTKIRLTATTIDGGGLGSQIGELQITA